MLRALRSAACHPPAVGRSVDGGVGRKFSRLNEQEGQPMNEQLQHRRQQWASIRAGGITRPRRHGAGLLHWQRNSASPGWFASVGQYNAYLTPQRDSDGVFWIAQVEYGEEPVHDLTCANRRTAARQAEATVQLALDTSIKDSLGPVMEEMRQQDEHDERTRGWQTEGGGSES